MKLVCDFKALLSALNNISVVADDSNSVDDIKNIIFYFDKGLNSVHNFTLLGVNNYIVYKHYLDNQNEYTVEFDEKDTADIMYMQIKTKDLISVLKTYSGLYRTKPESLTFILLDNGMIECQVVERDLTDDSTKNSTWTFNNVPMKELILRNIESSVTFPYVIDMSKEDFVRHITSMKDILTPNVTNYLGNVMFDEEYVYAIQQAFLTFMNNRIKQKNVFVKISLSYKIVQFMDKVLCKQENFKIARNGDKLYISTSTSESFIRVSDRVTDYQAYVKGIEKYKGFSVDRLLLKDNLKRLTLGDDTVVTVIVKPSAEKITLRTQRYRQDIDMLSQVNISDMSDFSFEISKDIFNKIIIGDDKDFSPNTFFYFTEPNNERKMSIYLTDDTEEWFTRIHVQVK